MAEQASRAGTTLAGYEGVRVARGDGEATISDKRQDKERACYFVVATDSFMSGWGCAPGRSLYALAIYPGQSATRVFDNLNRRPEFKYVRINMSLPRLRAGDHLSVADEKDAPIFYEGAGERSEA
jgi:hypothetical protein